MNINFILNSRAGVKILIPSILMVVIMTSGFLMTTATATPLNGPYTIDATTATGGTNFQSFTDFASSINLNGVSGDVVATVVAGTGPYTEQVVFTNIPGAGPSATVTIEGNGETITAVTNTNNRHVVRLTNCQYFTINNLHILRDPASTSGFYGIHVFSTGNHITISDCSVDMTGTISTLCGAYVASGSTTSILETGDFHNITVTGCYSTGGGYGVSVFGLVSNLASNIVITNNTLLNHDDNGVYLRETNGAVIANNTLDKNSASASNWNAIQMAQAANINALIYNNVITVSQANGSGTTRGIYLFNGTGHKVYNNVIQNNHLTSGNFTGIEIRSSATAPEIYYNTIAVDNTLATTGNLYGIKEELSNTNSILRNNMISISQSTSGTKSALVLGTISSVTTAFNSDYNNIWIPGGNVGQKGTLTTITYYPTLSDWQSVTGQDQHSTLLNPVYVSPVYSQPTNGLLDNTGTPIAWITEDITGATRGNPPDIGAYEFSAAPPATPDSILGSTFVCGCSTGVIYSVNPVTGATSYTWTVTGATLVSGQGTNTIVVDFSITPCIISVIAVNNTGSSSPATLNVSVYQIPIVNFDIPQDSVCINWPSFPLTGGTPVNGTYSGNGVTNNTFSPSLAGFGQHTITYTYEDINGCSAQATDIIFVDNCTNLEENNLLVPELLVYPNPCLSACNVEVTGTGKLISCKLFNHLGIRVKEIPVAPTVFTLTFDDLPAGLYFLEVMVSGGNRLVKKLEVR
jgi:hypothetical protein